MKKLTLFATLLALIVIVLGAYTRLSDAGLGCPDWPGCYGQLTVPQNEIAKAKASLLYQQTVEPEKAWIEMVHRYLAGTLGLCIFALAVWSLCRRKEEGLSVLPLMTAGLVIFQALLGMWTVTLKLSPPIILLHLLGGLAILSLLWWQFLRLQQTPPQTPQRQMLRPWIISGIVLLIIQIGLGGWTSANYAALICPDFPYCQGVLLPSMKLGAFFSGTEIATLNIQRVTIHMVHRIGALIVGLYLAFLALKVILTPPSSGLRGYGIAIACLLIAQISLGILNIVLLLPLQTAVPHNMVAAILLLALITLLAQCYPARIRSSSGRNHV